MQTDSGSSSRSTLSVAIITLNEEANLARTLRSVFFADEILVVDAGSTDGTRSIAESSGARFITEPWRGFAKQKNYALSLCTCDWVLSLDADEAVSPELAASIQQTTVKAPAHTAYRLRRRNLFLSRWIRHGGYYPDAKLRLFPRGEAEFQQTPVHETLRFAGSIATLRGDLLHDAYPTLSSYVQHMERYSTLGAGLAAERGHTGASLFSFLSGVVLNPLATFLYNYVVRLGFLDGCEGLLLHLYHSVYVSWKYAKAWEAARRDS